jgi:hypothetical protein
MLSPHGHYIPGPGMLPSCAERSDEMTGGVDEVVELVPPKKNAFHVGLPALQCLTHRYGKDPTKAPSRVSQECARTVGIVAHFASR